MGQLHTRAYRRAVETFPELGLGTRLVSCCDTLAANREQATTVLGFQRAVSDHRELICDPEVDVVSICAPNHLHREMALAAAEAGKPFWVEKPMGVSAAQSRDIALAAQRAGLVTSVGFNYRHAPAVQLARRLIAEGRLGRITNARVWLLADYASDPRGPLTWRYDPDLAGPGVVADLMGHGEDLLQYLLARPIRAVTALTGTVITERPVPLSVGVGHSGWQIGEETGPVGNEDHCAILARLDGGVVATLEASRVSVGPRAEYVVEVYGTEGSLRWNFEDLNRLRVCLGRDNGALQGYVDAMAGPQFPDFLRFQPSAGTSMGFDDLKVIEAALFLRGVRDGVQYGPSAADGWAAAEVDDAVVASAADGRWHEVASVSGQTTFDRAVNCCGAEGQRSPQ